LRAILFLLIPVMLSAQTWPLKVSSNKHYLTDQNDVPFFVNMESAWALPITITIAQLDTYLSDRKAKGYNSVVVRLIQKQWGGENNCNGLSPFTSTAFTTPREAYFAHIDTVFQHCLDSNFWVLASPAYGGYACDAVDGWCPEIQSTSAADMKTYGAYIGNRYKAFPNIGWLAGGDMNPIAYSINAKIDSMMQGIKGADVTYARLTTHHSARNSFGITYWQSPYGTPVGSSGNWLTLNHIYTDSSTTLLSKADSAYDLIATTNLPFFGIEFYFDNDGHTTSAMKLRAQGWWTILAGGMGQTFGACPIWMFGVHYSAQFCTETNWLSMLGTTAAYDLGRCGTFFQSKNWWTLVPDRTDAVMTAGKGSGATTARAAYASDSTVIIVYMPSNREVTMNTNVLKSANKVRARWYDPTAGTYTAIGMYDRSASQAFTPTEAQDWVLVLDSEPPFVSRILSGK
jgi:hypothetical protein